ncbi:hypothetical protein NKDENANG_02116 [Candidatus Entotheonellaceae bacterium PAL068K]
MLCIGDGKMSALEPRWHMEAWTQEGRAQHEVNELERIFRTNDWGREMLAAEGYACKRTCWAPERGEE